MTGDRAGGRVSGRHLLLSVIRFRECQYSVMRNPARQSSGWLAGCLAGWQHLATRSSLVRSASIIRPTGRPNPGVAFFHAEPRYGNFAACNKIAYCTHTHTRARTDPFSDSNKIQLLIYGSFHQPEFSLAENVKGEKNYYLS